MIGFYRRYLSSALCGMALAACATQTQTPTSAPSAIPQPTAKTAARSATVAQPIADGPTLLWNGIRLRKVLDVGTANVRLAYDAAAKELLYLAGNNDIYSVKLDGDVNKTRRFTAKDIGIDDGGVAGGLRFGADGTLYVMYTNKPQPSQVYAVLRAGKPAADGKREWRTVFRTARWQASNTNFDHLWNGITVSPDNKWIYINAGSRTDHGEIETARGTYPDLREVALTTKIMRVPTDATDLELPNDDAVLRAKGYIFADGVRNAFDLAFAPNGDLFGVDNGPDADYPDELNWLREGKHYGFPWRFGNYDNPQQFANYDAANDKRLSKDFVAVQNKTYATDPTYPKAPMAFSDPIINRGPASAQYSADDGVARDAATEGKTNQTFTPHISPLGLSFVNGDAMPSDYRGMADKLSLFLTSWGSAGGAFADKGQWLNHMTLTKVGDNYEAVTTQIARGFKNPIDTAIVGNKLYVLEYGNKGAIWELAFE